MSRFIAIVLSVLLCSGLWGQTPEVKPYNGTGFWAGVARPYMPQRSAAVSFEDSPRIDALIRAGRIYLSLRDALALALENNLDLEYARFGPRLSDANQLRADAGQLLRNVSTSIRSAPSSASLGVQAGASSLGTTSSSSSGGGQSGVLSGLSVQLAGSAIPNLDPVGYVQGSLNHVSSPQTSSFVTGTSALITSYKSLVYGVQQGFLFGTTATLGVSNTIGLNQNAPTNAFNPTTSGALSLSITQHLMQGFGVAVNNRQIRIARNQRTQSDLQFKQQVIATIAGVANLYWDLVSFNDNLKVKQEALELNQKLYTDNKRRAELGAIAPIDIVQAEAEVAASQQDLTTAELQVLQQEMILKSVLSRNGASNPLVAGARIVPTTHLDVPKVEPVRPVQDLISEAIASRPEVESSRISLENSRISIKGTRAELLPTLDAVVSLQNNGLAGSYNNVSIPAGTPPALVQQYLASRGANNYFLGGYGAMLAQVFGRNFPNYSVGFQLTVPLRNRAAQADLITDQLTYRQQQINDRQLQNNIRVNVINARTALEQARAAYDTSVKARTLQEQTLAGERRKYELGSSSFLNVVIVQRDTTTRRSAEVSALNQYIRARTNLQEITGRILGDYDVNLDEALRGQVKRGPDEPPLLTK